MLIRKASLRMNLNSVLACRVFLAPVLRTDAKLVHRQEVISIIDDNASIRTAIRRLIQSADLVVEEFSSAEEFLISGRSQNSACLILDLQLQGMRGLDLQKQLLISNPRLPIIFMSANTDEISTEQALRSGAIEFLEKPINEQALFAAINASLILFRSTVTRSTSSRRGG